MPALPLLFLASAAGVDVLGDLVSFRQRLRSIAIGLATAVLAFNAFFFSWPGRDPTLVYVSRINQGWTELGKWLKATTPPEAVVAVGAVGRIPYYSERYTIDMLGLTDTHIGRRDIPLGYGMPGMRSTTHHMSLTASPTTSFSCY